MLVLVLFLLQNILCNIVVYENQEIDCSMYARLGLAGFTPHPTQYIYKHGVHKFDSIAFDDIFDTKYCIESVQKIIQVAKNYDLSVLLISFLPIYYIALAQKYSIPNTIIIYQNFMSCYKNVIIELIDAIASQMNYTNDIIIHLPDLRYFYDFDDVNNFLSCEKRSSFLIKHFACMKFCDEREYTLFIINNMPTDEDDYIINNLKKMYFGTTISYQKIYLERKKFYLYKN
jgi:hypothetical protein